MSTWKSPATPTSESERSVQRSLEQALWRFQSIVPLADKTTHSSIGNFVLWSEITFPAPGDRLIEVLAQHVGQSTWGITDNIIQSVRVGISLDGPPSGGSTYTYGKAPGGAHKAFMSMPNIAQHFVRGVCTSGSVAVRVEVKQNSGSSGDVVWTEGSLQWDARHSFTVNG